MLLAAALIATTACGRDGFAWFGRSDDPVVDDPLGEDPLDQDPTVNDNIDLGPIAVGQLVQSQVTLPPTWNTYVRAAAPLSMDLTPCESESYRDCVHYSERLRVDVPRASVCAGLVMADSLDAFDWDCISHDGVVSFVSAGLKAGKGLRDLIDFETLAWRQLRVTLVSRTGSWTSPLETLWSNPIRLLDPVIPMGAEEIALAETDAVYVVKQSHVMSYRIRADGASLVTARGVTIGANAQNMGIIDCQAWDPNGGGFYGAPCAIAAFEVSRVWVEADVARYTAADDGIGIDFTSVTFSRINNVTIGQDFKTPLGFASVRGARVTGLTVSRATKPSSLIEAKGNFFRDFRGAGSGFFMLRSLRNAFERATVFGTEVGWGLYEDCDDNRFTQILSFANGGIGFHMHIAGNRRNTFAGFTLASTMDQAMAGWANELSTFHLGAVLNSGGMGFTTLGDRGTISDLLTSEHAGSGINVDNGAGPQRFTGQVRSANNSSTCYMDWTIQHAGFTDDPECAPEGLSDAYVLDTAFPRTAGSFVGLVTDEPANASAENAVAVTPTLRDPFDFAGASTNFRGWARAGEFLSGGQRGFTWWYDDPSFVADEPMHIVDFALRASDTVVRNRTLSAGANNGPWVDGGACPAGLNGDNFTSDIMDGEIEGDGIGNDDGTCDIGEACAGNVYLRGAIELLDDGVGDDDALCESNERCLYAPNFGAYQGHGGSARDHRCVFTNGRIANVRMYAYPVNGY